MPSYRVVYVDAFTLEPFLGNPCAILPEAGGLNESQMHAIARETNLNETSFVFPSQRADFRVRYFSPRAEIPFAGHPTIATVFLLAQEGRFPLRDGTTRIQLEFQIGVLPVEVRFKAEGIPEEVVMTQQAPFFGARLEREAVAPCLGLSPEDIRADTPVQVVSTGVPFLIVPAVDLAVLKVEMDRPRLSQLLCSVGVSTAFLFCLGGFSKDSDTHARLLDPNGTTEDPFTGSASGCMGAYIVTYGLKVGPLFRIEQGHILGRPGYGTLEVLGTPERISSIRLGGAAVKVMEGAFFVPKCGE
jgi:trans-2,3-dihydro-3-hydroxyanthranilate isomerase